MYRGFESYSHRMEVDVKEENEKFFYFVIKDLDYHGWKLEWYKDTSSEGYCWLNRKVINIGPENENVKQLILHEIAHHVQTEDPNHGRQFVRVHLALVRRWMGADVHWLLKEAYKNKRVKYCSRRSK